MVQEKKTASFIDTLKGYKGKQLAVISQGSPDPDWISSAFATQFIGKQYGVEIDIIYDEEIDRNENNALVKILGIDLIKLSDDTDFSQYGGICLVDSQGYDDIFSKRVKGLEVISIVDHHDKKTEGGLESKFSDIDQKTGAAATIYAGYLEKANLLKKAGEDEVNVSIALMHGILSDTGLKTEKALTANSRDYLALAYLDTIANTSVLSQILSQPLSSAEIDALALSIRNRDTKDNYLISNVGILGTGDRGAISISADYLIQKLSAKTVLVWGVRGEKVRGSIRTTDDSISLDKFLKEMIGSIPGSSFGTKDATNEGGFEFPLGWGKDLTKGIENEEALIESLDKCIKPRYHSAAVVKDKTPSKIEK